MNADQKIAPALVLDGLRLVMFHPDLPRGIRAQLTPWQARDLAEKLLEQADVADDSFAVLPRAVGIN